MTVVAFNRAEENMRGRPKLQMTHRRAQVLGCLSERAKAGERITLGELVRSCGLYDNSAAKRSMRDLRKMGKLA
jgi:hypothetical protein